MSWFQVIFAACWRLNGASTWISHHSAREFPWLCGFPQDMDENFLSQCIIRQNIDVNFSSQCLWTPQNIDVNFSSQCLWTPQNIDVNLSSQCLWTPQNIDVNFPHCVSEFHRILMWIFHNSVRKFLRTLTWISHNCVRKFKRPRDIWALCSSVCKILSLQTEAHDDDKVNNRFRNYIQGIIILWVHRKCNHNCAVITTTMLWRRHCNYNDYVIMTVL